MKPVMFMLSLLCTAVLLFTCAQADDHDAEIFENIEEEAAQYAPEEPEEAAAPSEEDAPLILSAAVPAPDDPDENYLLVKKEFRGLDGARIPESFRLVLSGGGFEYVLDRGNAEHASPMEWYWTVRGPGPGLYRVSESGTEVEGYSLTASGTDAQVEVTAASFDVRYQKETTCSKQLWPVGISMGENRLFAAALTTGGCVVVSKNSLSASQRETVARAVTGIGGNWKAPAQFYSIDVHGCGPWAIGKKVVEYHPDTEEIYLHRTSDWTHVATLSYTVTEADIPDIRVVNEYAPSVSPVTVRKAVTGNMADRDARFSFTLRSSLPILPGADYTLSPDGLEASFTLRHGEEITLLIPPGSNIDLEELASPGYIVSMSAGGTGTDGSLTVPASPLVIGVTNEKNAPIDTGIESGAAAYLPLLFVGALLAVTGRKKHEYR